jgi:hypothetical protein
VDPLSTSSCKKLRPWAADFSAGLHVLFFYFRIIQMTKPKKIQWLVPGGSCKSFSTSIVYTAPWSRNFCSNDLHDGVPQWVVGFLFFGGRNSSGSAISFSAAVSKCKKNILFENLMIVMIVPESTGLQVVTVLPGDFGNIPVVPDIFFCQGRGWRSRSVSVPAPYPLGGTS